MATSLISGSQAQGNHAAEVATADFDVTMMAAKAAWHNVATTITVPDVGAAYVLKEMKQKLIKIK